MAEKFDTYDFIKLFLGQNLEFLRSIIFYEVKFLTSKSFIKASDQLHFEGNNIA